MAALEKLFSGPNAAANKKKKMLPQVRVVCQSRFLLASAAETRLLTPDSWFWNFLAGTGDL